MKSVHRDGAHIVKYETACHYFHLYTVSQKSGKTGALSPSYILSILLFPVTGHSLLRICTKLGMRLPLNFWKVMGQFVKRLTFVFKRKSVK